MNLLPTQDGVTHINIYSKAETELGRLLSNFSHVPIETEDGHFESVEGYWGWLSISEENPGREQFRQLYGYMAKKHKTDLLKAGDKGRFDPNFSEKIEKAIDAKFKTEVVINCLTRYKDLLELPVVHYYYFGDKSNPKVVDVTEKCPEFINPTRKNIANFLQSMKKETKAINQYDTELHINDKVAYTDANGGLFEGIITDILKDNRIKIMCETGDMIVDAFFVSPAYYDKDMESDEIEL